MNADRLQELIDLARTASPQRWRLGAIGVAGATVAAIAAGFGIGPFVVLMVSLPAAIATVRAGSHAATAVIVIVVTEWLASADEVAAPGSFVVAIGLFVFHAAVALLAVTPHAAAADPRIVRAWTQRSLVVVGSTLIVWALVAAVERNEPATDATSTAVALTVLAAAAWAARSRTVPS